MQNTMQFIVENHANAMIRLDRFDEELKEQKKRFDDLRELVRDSTGHNNEVFRMLAEILASQSVRLQWI